MRKENDNLRSKIEIDNHKGKSIEELESKIETLNTEAFDYKLLIESQTEENEILQKHYNEILLAFDEKNSQLKEAKKNASVHELQATLDQQKNKLIELKVDNAILKTDLGILEVKLVDIKHHTKEFINENFDNKQLKEALEKYSKRYT